jgi:putative ABC transport system permease protein
MYPALTAPLAAGIGAAAAVLLVLAIRAPVLRRLALRQVARRGTECALVVIGSMLGTAIIVGSLVVGDTLGFSVRQVAYRTLGPVDERVVSSDAQLGQAVADRLGVLARDGDVDGVLSGVVAQAPAHRRTEGLVVAEPRVLAFDVDFTSATRFGGAAGASGISGAAPAPGHAVVNQPFADALSLGAGDSVSLYLPGGTEQLVVDRVVAARGLAGTGFGSNTNRNVFLAPGTLRAATGETVHRVTWVSNRGSTEEGADLTATVTTRIRELLGPIAQQVLVDAPKREVLRQADVAGDSLGSLFLMIGSFSIIAGALLLVNVFVMLAEERKGQLGALRATGLKRSRLVGAFVLEGGVYSLLAAALGVPLGILVGRGVAFVAARIFSSFSVDTGGLDVTFAMTGTSLVNGAGLGLAISLTTVVLTSVRISRFNVIAAIRDLDETGGRAARPRKDVAVLGIGTVLALLSVPVVAKSSPVGTFVLPALAATCAAPVLRRLWGRRAAWTIVSGAVLAWTLAVNVVRPGVYDSPSMAVFVVMGTQMAFSSVALISENQSLLLLPLRPLLRHSSASALAGRLALAYPLARRFRTGATLVMYSLITLVLVLLIEISGVMMHGIDTSIQRATAGYDLRLDFLPGTSLEGLESPAYSDQIAALTPLTSALATAEDPGHRTSEPLAALVVGVPPGMTRDMPMESRMAGLDTDAAVWEALATHREYVLVDAFFGSSGGPPGQWYSPGDSFTVTDPRSGTTQRKVIAGVLSNAIVFYSPSAPAAFPMVTDATAVRGQFGTGATVTSAFVAIRPGVDLEALAGELQGSYLSSGLVATSLSGEVRRLFDANIAFFRLMEGFLALGLLVGITGLGVVMVRSVRERRRSIGILRALGVASRTVQRSFLMESAFVAVEGVTLGALLGLLTTRLLYERSAMFTSMHTGFPVLWGTIGALVVATLVGSLLATLGPARRAAGILPAIATRVS